MKRETITGLVLAGGHGSRMGGVDKGLQPLGGQALIAHVLDRLEPQVGALIVNANRNALRYAELAPTAAIVGDADGERPGPLAGMLAGLRHGATEWLLCAPCDAPRLPRDLALRLATAAEHTGADVAVPITADGQLQSVCCLLRRTLAGSLSDYLLGGGRKVETWLRGERHVVVPFDRPADGRAFLNLNTLRELEDFERDD